MKLIARLEKSTSFWFLILISVIFFFLRWPSLFEPYWYGDEGIYQAVGMLIGSGQPLYSGAWDNKPPLLYVIYAMLSSDQFLTRTASLVFGLASIWVFYLSARKLFLRHEKAVYISTAVYALAFGGRLIEGNIANAENFMLLPILISAYLVISGDFIKKALHFKTYFLAGLILSLAFLTKIVAIFDFMAFSTFILIDPQKDLRDKFQNKFFPFILGFSVPVLTTMAYFFATDNFKDFMNAFVFSNIGYVGYGNEFLIPQGLLYLKAGLLFAFVAFLFWKRGKIDKNVIFVSAWFAFSLFNAFFAQRPYTHYLIVLLPSFCLMIGGILAEKKERFFMIIFLVLAFLAINLTFSFKGRFVEYYSNLLAFCSNQKDLSSYQSFFDGNTPRDYEIARYVRNNTGKNDSIFVWGNNAQIYKLSNKTPIFRYTVAYHITNYPTGIDEMEDAIDKKSPKFIVIMPNAPPFPLALNNYSERINIRNAIIYEKIL